MVVAGFAGFATISFLPGAWLAFGPRLPGVTLSARALLAIVISPVVVLAQFYALRWLGLPFPTTVVFLLVGNLLALIPVQRRWSAERGGWHLGGAIPYIAVWAIPLGLLFLHFHDLAANALRAHTFLHGDIVYALANGGLRVEEAQLAGIALGYPWGGHVHQAVLSWIWGTAPVANYAWTNILLMIAGVMLLAQVTARMGGGLVSRIMTVVMVLFAVNAVGYVLQVFLVPESLLTRWPVWGESSVMPWMRKYSLWNQHPYAHGLFAGIMYFMVGTRSEAFSKSSLALVGVLLAGLAFIYPTFVPAAAAILAARFLVEIRRRPKPLRDLLVGRIVPLAAVVLLGAALTALTLFIVGQDRVAGTGVALSSSWQLKVKTIETLIALSPLTLAIFVLFWKRRSPLPEGWDVLLLSGLASVVLYLVFAIQEGVVDYKFTFTAAMCLAPVAALGFDRFLSKGGFVRVGAAGLFVLLLVGTGSDRFLRFRVRGEPPLAIRVDEFPVRLAEDHELQPSMSAILAATDPRTIVVVDSPAIHVPVFAQRSLYAPPLTDELLLGVGMRNAYLLGLNRGYGSEIVDQRQEVTRHLFRSESADSCLSALDEIRRLGRPVAILLNLDQHAPLLRTLEGVDSGEILHRDERWAVWLAPAAAAVASTGSRPEGE